MIDVYPAKIPTHVQEGQILVHNTVKVARRQGTRGFRYWLADERAPSYAVCLCPRAPELPVHYRVVRADTEVAPID